MLGSLIFGARRQSPSLGARATRPPASASAPAGFTLSAPQTIDLDTTLTNNLSADGFTWAQADPILIDKHGNLIVIGQDNSGNKECEFIFSTDGGETWADSTLNQGFLGRGAMAYDPDHDTIHVLWNAASASDGIIYRRYLIAYSGAAISGFTRDTDINLQLDFNASQYEHPCLLYCADIGALLAVWSARNGGGNEIRSSMRVLSYTAADNTAGNWSAPVTSATTTISQSPAVAYSTLLANTAVDPCYPAIARKASGTNALDVTVVYHNGGSPGSWQVKRLQWNAGSGNWSTGLTTATTITGMARSGSDTGYSLKEQLSSKVVQAGDAMCVALPTWKSNTDGDTWGIYKIDAADAVTFVDVYSAGGAHSYAPTGDLSYDAESDRLVVSYIKTTSAAAYLATYTLELVVDQAETLIYDDAGVDIPLLCGETRYDDGDGEQLLCLFRDIVNSPTPPYHGHLVKLAVN